MKRMRAFDILPLAAIVLAQCAYAPPRWPTTQAEWESFLRRLDLLEYDLGRHR